MLRPATVRGELFPIVFVLTLALLSAELSVRLRAETMSTTFAAELGTLSGHAARTEFQNRVLSPMLQALLRAVFPASTSDKSVWFALRVIEAAVAYVGFYLVTRRLTRSRLRSLVAISLVAYFYFWTTLTHPWEYPSDFFDILFVSMMVWLALERRLVPLAFVVLLTSTNRESAAFGGIIWTSLSLTCGETDLKRVQGGAVGLALIVLALGAVLLLRASLGSGFQGQEIGLLSLFSDDWRWMLFLDGPTPTMVATLFTLVAVLYIVPRPWSPQQRGLLLATLACAAITLVFGIAAELRVWLPCCTMIALLAVIGGSGQSGRDWIASLLARAQ